MWPTHLKKPTHLKNSRSRESQARPAGSPSPLRIGELLLRRALIDHDDLTLALSEQSLSVQSPPLGRLLVGLGAIDEDVLVQTLAEQSGMRIVDLGAGRVPIRRPWTGSRGKPPFDFRHCRWATKQGGWSWPSPNHRPERSAARF